MSIACSCPHYLSVYMKRTYNTNTFKLISGSYSGTKDIQRGAQFYATPSAVSDHTHLTMTLEYEVFTLILF